MTKQESITSTRPAPSFRITLAGLIAALSLAALDGNIVGTALPVIASDLDGLSQLSWVITAFMLAQCASLLMYGKLSDMYGRRPLFLFAVCAFVLGSLACGLAQTMLQLILLRAIQGIGAAGIMTLSSATLADLVSPRDRGRYQGYFMATFAICSIAGPLVGGIITATIGWRWIFLINLPLGAIVLAILMWTLPAATRRETHDIDYAGAGLIVLSTVSGLLALSWGGAVMPWFSPAILGLLTFSALMVAMLIAQENRATEPVLDLGLFRDRVFTTTQITNALVAFPFFGAVVYLPLYLQMVRGFDPAQAGLIIVPQLAGLLLSSIGGGMIVSRVGRYKPFITAGVTTNGISLATIGAFVHFDAPLPFIMIGLLMLGIGGGMCMPNMTVAVQNAVSRKQLGAATAFTTFANTLAAAAGVATSGAILVGRVRIYIAAHAHPAAVDKLANSGVKEVHLLSMADQAIVHGAYAHAISATFLWGGLMVAASAIASLFIPNRELISDRTAAPGFE
jgi:EmrB/QacA subfamily drug resistance transporter